MIQVNRLFRDLIRTSPALQHQCNLFAIGLIDNPCSSYDLAERRKLREEYARRWSNTARLVKNTRELPPGRFSPDWSWCNAECSGNGLLAVGSDEGKSLSFLHVPLVASRKPVEEWSIPLLPGEILRRVVYPPENVVAVAEEEEECAAGVPFLFKYLATDLDRS